MAGRTKLTALVAALLCLLLCAPTATAAILGSLEVIEVTDPVWLYPLRDNYGTIYPDFAGAGDLMKEIYDNPAASAKKLAAYAKAQKCTPTEVKPDENGIAFFGDLPLGLYLICSSSGEFLPFFIQIPTMFGDEAEYFMEARPKVEEPPAPTQTTAPTEPKKTPTTIPQTGVNVIPKYILMCTGTAVTLYGLWELLRGREDSA